MWIMLIINAYVTNLFRHELLEKGGVVGIKIGKGTQMNAPKYQGDN